MSTGYISSVAPKTDLQRIIAKLDLTYIAPNDRFEIRYCRRNPGRGRSNGLLGVRDERIIKAYGQALSKTYDHLYNDGWQSPVFDGKRIQVYVFNATYPFTSRSEGRPFLVLRAELSEPTLADTLLKGAVDATHEATHVFTHVHLRTRLSESRVWWPWFDEATAVYFESLLNPANPATLRFARNWINLPEQPMEMSAGYSSAWFVRYLVNEHDGPAILREVWKRAQKTDSPSEVIHRLLQEYRRFASFEDFVHRYSIASQGVASFDPQALERFGPRAVAYSLPIDGQHPTLPHDWVDVLGPLGCRYYQIGPAIDAPRSVHVVVSPTMKDWQTLRATVVLDSGKGTDPRHLDLNPDPAGAELTTKFNLDTKTDHALLVVTNTETHREALRRPDVNKTLAFKVSVA